MVHGVNVALLGQDGFTVWCHQQRTKWVPTQDWQHATRPVLVRRK
jgi:hypothetical protein